MIFKVPVNILSLIILILTVIGLVILVAGFVPQRWITAEFDLVVNGSYLAKSRPVEVYALVKTEERPVFDKMKFTFHVTSKMGLFKNCKDRKANLQGNDVAEYSCDSEGAQTWQKLAFALAVGSLFFGTICSVTSAMGVFMSRYKKSIKFRFAIVLLNVTTGCAALAPVLMYAINRKIQVVPPLPDMVTFDIGWALFLMLGGASVFGFLTLLNAFMIAVLGKHDDEDEANFDGMKMNRVGSGNVAGI